MFGKAVSISALTVLSQVVLLVWGAPTDFYTSVIATVSAETPTDSGVVYAENGGLNEIGALPNFGYDNTDLTLQNVQQNSHQQSNIQEISDASNGDSKDLPPKYYAYVVEHDDDNQEQTSIKGESPKTPGPQLLQINPEWFSTNDISTISILYASAQPTTEKSTIAAIPQSEPKTEVAPNSENKDQEQFSYRYLHEVALNQAKGVEIVYTSPDESAKTTSNSINNNNNNNNNNDLSYEVHDGSPEESGNNQDNEYGYQVITVQSHKEDGTNQNNQKQSEEKSVTNEPNSVSSQPSNEPQLVVSTEQPQHNETATEKTTPKPYVPYVKVEFHVGNHKYNWGSSPTKEPIPFFATAKINEDRSANSTKEKC